MTFSLVARCPRTGCFGVGATTALPAVGKLVAHAWPQTGAAATQARLNPYLGIDGIALMKDGMTAPEALGRLCDAEPRTEVRQFALVDWQGTPAVWTGAECLDWAGHEAHENLSVQGNRLAGPQVLRAAVEAFRDLDEEDLHERLLAGLEAGVAAGGDTDGEHSGTVFVVDKEEYPIWDIRVDHHEDPVAELRRLQGIFANRLVPEIRKMPTRARPAGDPTEESV